MQEDLFQEFGKMNELRKYDTVLSYKILMSKNNLESNTLIIM